MKKKKFKLLKYGQAYINRDKTFVFILLGGNKKNGYHFLGNSKEFILGDFYLLSRVVPNDGSFIEINLNTFNSVSIFHVMNSSALKFKKDREVQLIYNR